MHSRLPVARQQANRAVRFAGAASAIALALAGCGSEGATTDAPEPATEDEERVSEVGGTEPDAARDEPRGRPADTAQGPGGDLADDAAADLDRFDIEHHDLGERFGELDGTFVLHEVGSDASLVHGADAADEPYQPASTFKIANALIALETGVVADVDEVRERDPALAPEAAWWPEAWLQPLSMETGFPTSAVWLFQAIARDIGPDRMSRWLSDLDYGNADIGGGIDRFWLDGDLRISATQQVGFLRRLLADDLPASPTNQQQVRDLMRLDTGDGWTLYGKTGWTGYLEAYDGLGVGWFVGWVESHGTQWVFATRLEVPPGTDLAQRERLTRAVLTDLGVLPEDGA